MSKVWFITGCFSGFGRDIAVLALERGDTVVATARDLKKLADLEELGAITQALNVTWGDERLSEVVSRVLEKTGHIDIVVNNAGYVFTGAIEEMSHEEALHCFNTNVLGQLNIARAVLPHMRSRRSGVIANFGSLGGYHGIPGAGVYCAAKAACTIHSETLRLEVAHLGIEVTAIEPGYFRTDLLGDNMKRAEKRIPDLAESTDPTYALLAQANQNQPGDPKKASQVIVEALTKCGRCEGRELPVRMVLGVDATMVVPQLQDKTRKEIEEWKELTGAATAFS